MAIKTTVFTRRPRVSFSQFSLCWWRHNRLLMTSQLPVNCDAITRIVISNSLDIDFIHGDIHDRSCKKRTYLNIRQDCCHRNMYWSRNLLVVTETAIDRKIWYHRVFLKWAGYDYGVILNFPRCIRTPSNEHFRQIAPHYYSTDR